MSDAVLEGLLFDGRSAAATPARVVVAGGVVTVTTPEGALIVEDGVARLSVTEAFGSAPRQIRLPGGAVVEVADGAALTAALGAAGRCPGLVDRLEARWRAALAAVVACVGVLVAAYVYGLPAAARWIARTMPASAERRLGDSALEILDGNLLQPSTIAEETRRAGQKQVWPSADTPSPPLLPREG